VAHPFHPLAGQELELVGYGQAWGEDRVFYRTPAGDHVATMPVGWTDLGPEDAFVSIAAGRSLFRVEDLLQIVVLVGPDRCK
jgi:hypothetical protein